MSPRDSILRYLMKRGTASGRALRQHLGVSRQALSVHLRELIRAGQVTKSGSTRGACYSAATRPPPVIAQDRVLGLRGLDEGRVYDQMALSMGLGARVRDNVEAIVRYGFTEMLNNAIEHSEAERAQVQLRLEPGSVTFEVRDSGIGVFHSIASRLGLPDEQAALVELLKGRTTTQRERHSGEGLFFTSRAADHFVLRSHRIRVEWSRPRGDVFVSQERFLAGTKIEFRLDRSSRRRLQAVFSEFAPAEFDYRFEKTRVLVKLMQAEYVSRSEARRLMANLEKFREVALDFRAVRAIGQGFADEIFRVFPKAHPAVRLVPENVNPVVAAMIRHVAGGPEGSVQNPR